MAKINMPIGENGLLDYSAEAAKLNELIMNEFRTVTGTATFASSSSGLSYSTDDYADDPEIYNNGEYGMVRLLQKLYGGENGWLVMADDLNEKQDVIRHTEVTLSADDWVEDGTSFRHEVQNKYITANTRIDLRIGNSVYQQLVADSVNMMYVENNDGTASVIAVGAKPSADIVVQMDFVEIGEFV